MKNYLWKLSVLQFLIALTIVKSYGQKETPNLSFENLNKDGSPFGWELSFGMQNDGYKLTIDSLNAQDGNKSLSIQNLKLIPNTFGIAAYTLNLPDNNVHKIKIVALAKGNTKSRGEGVIYLNEINENEDQLSHAYVDIDSTDTWTKYTVEDVVKSNAKQIVFGAALNGTGNIQVDNFNVFIDDQPISANHFTEISKSNTTEITQDWKIETINLNTRNTKLLTNVGMIWGLLKYYHPAVTSGKYNWDNELLKILPSILDSSNTRPYTTIYNWIAQLGEIKIDKEKKSIPLSENPLNIQPEFGNLFERNNLPKDLSDKLKQIVSNFKAPKKSHYISLTYISNPIFTNENNYSESPYPNLGLRLISLFRYWNMIEYFYPYRKIIGSDWNETLTDFLPLFVNAKDKNEYTLACLRLISNIHDTHANIYWNITLDSIKGNFMSPFKAEFIENRLVVTDYYKDTLGISQNIHIGDVIDEIDGIAVDSLIKKYIDFSPASNQITALRVLASSRGFLLRSNDDNGNVTVNHKKIKYKRILSRLIPDDFDFIHSKVKETYKLLPENIGYVNPARVKEKDISIMQSMFKNTKGLIFDFRCYPISFPIESYGKWLKSEVSPFVKITSPSLKFPGAITYATEVYNGKKQSNYYKNKIVILVNEVSQSAAEYQTMALSSTPNSVVIGSTTAGADGDISKIILPGNILTYISGLGIYYPDGTGTQRVGVKCDITIMPTISGIKNGRDELLEKAIEVISKN